MEISNGIKFLLFKIYQNINIMKGIIDEKGFPYCCLGYIGGFLLFYCNG